MTHLLTSLLLFLARVNGVKMRMLLLLFSIKTLLNDGSRSGNNDATAFLISTYRPNATFSATQAT